MTDLKSLQFLARTYLDLQQLRISCEHRIRKIVCPDEPDRGENQEKQPISKANQKTKPEVLSYAKVLNIVAKMEHKDPLITQLIAHRNRLYANEKDILKDSGQIIVGHPIWEFAERVKGMGPVACLTFLGHIDPYICDTVGKLYAYAGLIPGARAVSGKQSKYNMLLKGRFYIVAQQNIIMARDPYYAPLYRAKKVYLTQGRSDIVAKKPRDDCQHEWPEKEEPSKIENHSEQRREKPVSQGNQVRKSFCIKCGGEKGWKAHYDHLAKLFMEKIVLSNVHEIMRKAEGLPITAPFHEPYAPPKPNDFSEQREILSRIIPMILLANPEKQGLKNILQYKSPGEIEKLVEQAIVGKAKSEPIENQN